MALPFYFLLDISCRWAATPNYWLCSTPILVRACTLYLVCIVNAAAPNFWVVSIEWCKVPQIPGFDVSAI